MGNPNQSNTNEEPMLTLPQELNNTIMKEYEIWCEGYSATGEHSDASFIGKSMGETFEDAVKNFRYPDDVKRQWCMPHEDPIIIHKGSPLNLDTDKEQPDGFRRFGGKLCSWACRYFDNEADARKSFG